MLSSKKVVAKRYSFQTVMSTITQVTTMAGLAKGSTMRRIICRSLAPSMREASSISTGIVSKYPFMFHKANTHMEPA